MIDKKLFPRLLGLVFVLLLLVACGGQAAEPAASIPTTAPPTDTPAPPTETPIPPTATSVPPTETPLPPTPEPTATKQIKIFPPKQGYVTLVDDSESGLMVMFGGQTGPCCSEATVTDRTWIFDAAANLWTLLTRGEGPSARAAVAMAYDSESDRVILLGGVDANGQISNDTWAYNTNAETWTEMSAEGPVMARGMGIAYDTESDRIIIFGGSDWYFSVDDTWSYDFNTDTWTEMKPDTSPPAQNYHAATYDIESDRVLVWGFIGTDLEPSDASVWAYDYNTNSWEQMPLVEPYPELRTYPELAYDAESDRTILYGGFPEGDQTWAYDYNSNTWTRMNPATTPQKVSRHALAYSAAADRVILSGGQVGAAQFNYTRDTWSYDYNSDTWTFVGP
jgi:hypothetical protein